jgi:hypothetical protein
MSQPNHIPKLKHSKNHEKIHHIQVKKFLHWHKKIPKSKPTATSSYPRHSQKTLLLLARIKRVFHITQTHPSIPMPFMPCHHHHCHLPFTRIALLFLEEGGKKNYSYRHCRVKLYV